MGDSTEAALERLFTGPTCQGICGGDTPASTVRGLGYGLGSSPGAPTPNERVKMDQARAAVERIVGEVNALFRDQVEPLRRALVAAGYTPFPEVSPLGPVGGAR